MKYIISILLTFTGYTICFAQKSNDIEKLTFLHGSWKVENKQKFENWELKEDGSLQGCAFSIQSGRKIISENMEIKQKGQKILFLATVQDQNAGATIPFELKTKKNQNFVFENPDHDFPQKIVYQKLNSDEIFISVSGNNNERFSYKLKRVDEPKFIPDWFFDDLERNIGTWITDNKDYNSDNNIISKYGIEWTWGIGKTSIIGRLFGITDTGKVVDFWQFRQYWDNVKGRGMVEQFGYDGVTGIGEIKPLEKDSTETIQTFSDPGGSSWKIKHTAICVDSTFSSTSYDWVDGNWRENPTYLWKKKPTLDIISKSQSEKKPEVLLLGTFHFHNPGADMVKTKSFDILSNPSQLLLQDMSNQLVQYNPTKIFVEWPYHAQDQLDSLYNLYKLDPGDFYKTASSEFYKKNEIFQLGFRVANQLGLEKLFAVDFHFDNGNITDSLMRTVIDLNQDSLKSQIMNMIKQRENMVNNLIDQGTDLKTMLKIHNSKTDINENLNAYIDILIRAGDMNNSVGAHFVSEWYKRNIYIWSLIRKQMKPEDQKVMVLFGAGHTALWNQIIDQSEDINLVHFEKVIK